MIPGGMDTNLIDSGVDWIGQIPEHWDTTRIRFVARLESGHTPSRSVDEYWQDCNIPWVTTKDIKKFRNTNKLYLEDTENKISEKGLKNSGARILPKDTVFLSRTASVGFSGVMGQKMATSQDFANWVCGPKVVPEYLAYVFRAMQQEFSRLMQGSTHQTIYMPDIRSLQMPLPPIDEQKEIANFISDRTDLLSETVVQKKDLRGLLSERRRAISTQYITGQNQSEVEMSDTSIPEVDLLPKHWEEVQIGWLIRSLRNGWSPNASSRAAEGEEYGVLKLSAASEGEFKPQHNKALPPTTEVPDSSIVERGNVLVTRANTPELVADACTVDQHNRRLIAPDLMFIIETDTSQIYPNFLSEWLVTPPARAQIRMDAHGSSGSMVKVSQQNLKSWVMPLPPQDEQKKILEKINRIREETSELKSMITETIDLLEEKRQGLITAAVTGEIDVSEVKNEAKASHT